MMLLRIIASALFPFLFLLGFTSVVAVSGMDMDSMEMDMVMDTIDSTKTTCGECLPVGGYGEPLDDMYLVTRLWTIADPTTTSDMDIFNEFNIGFAPIVTSMPGFVQYTAAQTGNTSTVFFQNLFDSKENADAAQQAAKDFVSTNDILKDGAIVPYYFTEDVVAYDDRNDVDCVNTSNKNKFLATRLYEALEVTWTKDTLGAMLSNQSNAEAVSEQSGFVNHIASVSVSEEDGNLLFFSDVFDSADGANTANSMGLNAAKSGEDTNPLDVLAVTMGQIVFDYICTITTATTTATDETTTATDETTGSTSSNSIGSLNGHHRFVLLSIATITLAGYML